jgi:hypothetical protein
MGTAIPKQHPAVVLRSQFNLVRGLLAVAMVALVGLTIAVVILANDKEEVTTTPAGEAAPAIPDASALPAYPTPEAASPGSDRDYSGAAPTRKLDGSTDIPSPAPVAPGTRYDGGPDEGTRGPLYVNPSTGYATPRYDGGPEEGTRGPLASPAAPNSVPEESPQGPGARTD